MSWASKFAKPYRVDKGKKFRLKDYDPADTYKLHSQEHAEELLAKGVARTAELQDMLYAQNRWGLLLLFQAMNAAGQRWDHQARDVRGEPAGLSGLLF